jgi:predicted enzyme related to lactoylglutathione lyase
MNHFPRSYRKMKKNILITMALLSTFCFGFALKSVMVSFSDDKLEFRKVTGIGGIFFKCKDPKKVREWYQHHLGLNTNQYGAVFEWRQGADSSKKGFSQWSPFSENTKYFAPSTKDFMINYRVADLDRLVDQLKKEGVTITDSIERAEYGKFVHIMDIEGNKIELWEPNDVEYEKMGKLMGAVTTK